MEVLGSMELSTLHGSFPLTLPDRENARNGQKQGVGTESSKGSDIQEKTYLGEFDIIHGLDV